MQQTLWTQTIPVAPVRACAGVSQLSRARPRFPVRHPETQFGRSAGQAPAQRSTQGISVATFATADAPPAESRGDFATIVAAAAFAAHQAGKLNVDRTFLLKAFAVLALVNSVIGLLKQGGTFDNIATVAAPAALAVYVLNLQVSFLDATTAILGWHLAERTEGLADSHQHLLFWGTVASLALCLYKSYGTLWYVAAFGIVHALRLFRSRSKDGVSTSAALTLPAVAISGWALYANKHYVWALLLYIGQIGRALYTSLESLASKVEKET